ncbi:MAG: hypothetical protein ABIR26_11175 [Ramlibacter sp.]
MNKRNTLLPILMAGMLAAAGAQAQSISPSGSSDAPMRAGEASTQTMGAPNAKTTNSPYTDSGVYVAPAVPAAIVSTLPAPATVISTGPATMAVAPALMRSPEEEVMSRRARFEAQRRAIQNGMGSQYYLVW